MDFLGIHCADSRNLSFLPDESVDLVVTSPPYNAGIAYDAYDDSRPFDEYIAMLEAVWLECWRVLRVGGRIAINVAGVGRSPYLPLQAYITMMALRIGFWMRGEIIWRKGAIQSQSTAWGSWCSPNAPALRDEHEYILVFSKQQWALGRRGETDLTPQEFIDCTRTIWEIQPEASDKGHPAPFPLQLATRLIKLYSYKGDVVLDPFMGSGTTCQAAELLDRKWIGVDISENYCKLARVNLQTTQRRLAI